MASRFHLELALMPEGWRRDVVVRIDHGVISSVEEPDDRPGRAHLGRRRARPAQPAQPRLPARHGGPHRAARQRRRLLLDLARGDVPLRRAARAGRSRGDRRLRLHGNARGGLYARGRVPLPASSARRPALRQRGRDVGAHRGGGRFGGHRSHAPAGALSPQRLSRQAADAGAAPLRVRSRPLCAADGNPGARRQHRHRAPFAARRHPGRSAVGCAHLARPAGAYPRRRTDARGRGVPGRSRQAADRSAARHGRGRCPSLVPGPRHARRRRRAGAHRQSQCRGRAVPDHRSQSRRRPVRCVGVPGPGRPIRHRLGFADPHFRRRRAAHPGIRPAADASAAQRAGRGDALDRPAIVRGGGGRRRAGDGRRVAGWPDPHQRARGLRGAGPPPSRARRRAGRQPARCLAVRGRQFGDQDGLSRGRAGGAERPPCRPRGARASAIARLWPASPESLPAPSGRW